MASTRRTFLAQAAAIAGTLGIGSRWNQAWSHPANWGSKPGPAKEGTAVMTSTWNHGMLANDAGFQALDEGGSALDMIEAGARLVEADAEGD